MKYMLMMHAPRAGWTSSGIGTRPPEDIKAHIGFMMAFNKELKASGELIGAEGLAGTEAARVVRAGGTARRRSPTAPSPRPRSSSPATGLWTAKAPSAPPAEM